MRLFGEPQQRIQSKVTLTGNPPLFKMRLQVTTFGKASENVSM